MSACRNKSSPLFLPLAFFHLNWVSWSVVGNTQDVKRKPLNANRKILGSQRFPFCVSRSTLTGFTVIELLITVSMVVMLGTLVITNFVDQPKKGRDGKRKADLHEIRGALESYNDDKGCYPSKDSVSCSGAGLSPYLSKIFCDPKTGESYLYDPDSSSLTCPTFYWLYAKLEYGKDPGINTVGCASGCGPGNAYNFKVGSPNAQ